MPPKRKTYSVTFRNKKGNWITNIGEFDTQDDIDWGEVVRFAVLHDCTAYGYQHGVNSRNLTEERTRTVLWTKGN